VVGQSVCCFPTGVRQRFPRDAALGELQAESYVGVTLRGHDHRPIGLIAVIGRRPLKNPALAQEVLQLVTGRAAGELVRAQADAEIRRLLEFNRGTLDSLSAHLCVLDEAGRILAVNRAWREFATANPPTATRVAEGANYLDVCVKAAGGERSSALALVHGIQAVARGEMTEYQQEYPCHAPYERRWFVARVTRFFEAGQVRIVVAHVNLTDRKLAELALQESEYNYRSLMDQAADGIFIADPQGRYIDVNRAGCELLDRSREEILQLSMHEVVAPEDQAAVPVADRLRELNAGRSVRAERQLVRKDGTIVNVEISARRLADGRLQGIHRDVTERRRAEEELRRISRWLFATQRISATGGWAINLKTSTVWASPEARRIYGFGDGELSLPAIRAFPLAQFRPVLDLALKALITEGKPYDVEFQVARGSDGAIVDLRSVAEYNAEEHLVLGVVQDITERKRAEAALRESEEKFSKAFRDSPVAMAIRDLETDCYLDVNNRCLAMTGYSREETVGHSPTQIGWMTEDNREENRQHMTAPAGVTDREIRLRHKDGRTILGAYTSRPLRVGGRPCLLSITLDITARKAAEQSLLESEAKFRSYVSFAPVGVVVADGEGRHIDANRAAEEMLGYEPGGLLGTFVNDMPVPEDAEAARLHSQQVVAAGSADGEFRLRHRAGSAVWVAVRAGRISANRFLAVYKDVTERKRLELEREGLLRDLARKIVNWKTSSM
jgi:PAS domain S-box-containing protein